MILARQLFVSLTLTFCVLHELTAVCNGDIVIETVPVGNAGNPADSRTGIGAVSYDFQIGKYEVTNAQYADFLNHVSPTGPDPFGLYHLRMATRGGIVFDAANPNGSKYTLRTGWENVPVNHINFIDAFRFANWMNNGQGQGSTETGAYTLLGGTPIPNNAATVTRNPGATWFIPNEDEWYKAAFHKNNGAGSDYWTYPTKSDIAPYSDQPPGTDSPDSTNVANYTVNDNLINGYNDGSAILSFPHPSSLQSNFNNVGAYSNAAGPYGTFDLGGNVGEWTETFAQVGGRWMRGGSWASEDSADLSINGRLPNDLQFDYPDVGFRVAMIPEPSTIGVIVIGICAIVRRLTKQNAN